MASDRILIGTGRGIEMMRTNDGGDNWRLEQHVLIGNSIAGEGIKVTSDPKIIYAATRNNVFRSDDGGYTWEERSEGLPKFGPPPLHQLRGLDVHPSDPDIIFVCTGPVELHISKDGGRSWEKNQGLEKLKAEREWPYPASWVWPHFRDLIVDPKDPDKMYGAIQIGGVVRTEDGGKTWEDSVEGIDPDTHTLLMDSQDSNTIYAITGGGCCWTWPRAVQSTWGKAIYKSTDGAKTWNPLTARMRWTYGEIIRQSPADPSFICAGVARGVPTEWARPTRAEAAFISSTDGGENWDHASSGNSGLPEFFGQESIKDICFDPNDPNTLFMCTGDDRASPFGQVYFSRDRGAKWHHLVFTPPAYALACPGN